MELSEFIAAYEDSGKTLLEVKLKDNLDRYLCMFAGLLDKPGPVPITPDKALSTLKGTKGTQYGTYTTKGTSKKEPKNSVYYIGTGCKPEGQKKPMIFFDEADWNTLLARFEEGKQMDAGKEPPTDSPEAALSEKERKVNEQTLADQNAETASKALDKAGYTDKGGSSATRNLFRQIYGFGGTNPWRKAALKRWEAIKQKVIWGHGAGPPSPEAEAKAQAEEAAAAAKDSEIILGVITKVATIAEKLKKNYEGDPITAKEKEFLRDCLRLRGTGKSRGIYLVGGDKCGGELAEKSVPFQDGGSRYGVKIGNQNSAIYAASMDIHDYSLKKTKNPPNPLYEEDGKGKPKAAIFWGSTDASRMSSYRAMDGVLNEYGPRLAQAWIKCGRKKCPELKAIIEEMLGQEQFNLNLLIFGAEQRNAGNIPDIQYIDEAGEGAELILDDIEAAMGNVDGPTALAWYVGSLLNSWDAVVSDPRFKDCEYEVVGRGKTGIQPDGTAINQDIQMSCARDIAKEVAVNPKNQVKSGVGIVGGDDEKNRDHPEEGKIGVNVKTSNDGSDVAYGKRGCAVIDEVERDDGGKGQIIGLSEKNRKSRERHFNYLYGVSENYPPPLTVKDYEEAEKYKLDEINAVDNAVKALEGLPSGNIDTVMKDVKKDLPFDDLGQYQELETQLQDVQNSEPGSDERAAAIKKLRLTVTNAYRNKNQDKPGFRTNMAMEYCQAGMATNNQSFVLTKPGAGDTYLGSESDAVGSAACQILGLGREGGEAPIASITGTGVTFEGGITLRRRLKDGVMVTEAIESTDNLLPRLEKLSGAAAANTGDSEVGNSAMKAEDFVRQLQELIKRIDKISPV